MGYKIGIFGCTADPFTLAHREIVKQVLEQKLVDIVYVCPTIVTWHRKGYTPWLDDNAKTKVIEAMLEDTDFYDKVMMYNDDLRIRQLCIGDKALEEKYVKSHRFIDTLMKIKSMYDPVHDDQFYPIVGSDEYIKFESWHAYESILKQSAGLIVAVDENGCGRDGKKVEAKSGVFANKTTFLKIDSKFRKISASKIRKEFKSYENYIAWALDKSNSIANSGPLLHTPIFDVVKGSKTKTGLEPVLVNAPDWVTVVVESRGKLLIEKQWRYGSKCAIEEFPCGMVEKGEDPLDAAVRELEEETGIKVLDKVDVVKLGKVSPNPAFMTNTMHYFYVNLNDIKYEKTKQKLDTHESIECFWKDIESFCQKTLTRAVDGKGVVPSMLVTAMALYSFYQMGIETEK